MKNFKKVFFVAITFSIALFIFSNQVFASTITKDEVQAAVDSVGKEQVTGNILIWFLCAIAFLKISQKIDSYLATLGVNVGHTGGSMLGDAMVVMKGLSMIKSGGNMLGGKFGGGPGNSGPSSGGGFLSGGLAGAIGRQINNSAAASATGLGGNPITGKMFDSSLSSGGQFANDIIGKIAKGDINKTGSITGDKAASALTSYLGGASSSSPASGLSETPEGGIGQAMIEEPSVSDGPADLTETQGSVGSPEIGETPFAESAGIADLTGGEMSGPEIGSMAVAEDASDEGHLHIPESSVFDKNPINNADYTTTSAADGGIEASPSIPTGSEASDPSPLHEGTTELPGFDPISGSMEGSSPIGTAPFTEQQESTAGSTGPEKAVSPETIAPTVPIDSPASVSPAPSGGGAGVTIGAAPFTESHVPETSASGGISESGSSTGGSVGEHSLTPDTGSSVSIGETSFTPDAGSSISIGESSFTPDTGSSTSGSETSSFADTVSGITIDSAPQISDSNVTVDSVPQISGSGTTVDSTPQLSGSSSAVSFDSFPTTESVGYSTGSGSSRPIFSDVEIGGGRIMGTETTQSNPGGIKFGMYDTAQYAEPSGDFSIVNTIDGSKWYKQYAVDTVKKTPYKNEDGKIVYKEELVKALPQVPRRKDKM